MNIHEYPIKIDEKSIAPAWKKEKHIHRYREVPPIEHFALFVIEPSN